MRVFDWSAMKILVLDSDKSACDLLVRTLQGFFPEHDWLTAGSYDEGRQLVDRGEHLDFVLADLKTNESGGPSLAHLIEGLFPEVQVYFLGTYSQETTFFRARPGRVFAKPVNVHEVVAAIHLAEENLALKQKAGSNPTNEGTALEKINRLIANEGFSGQLAQFQLHELVQICCLGLRTGKMSVTKGVESGALYFHEGRLLHAECGELIGDAAASRIIGWKSGQFAFADGILADRETIESSWDFLLLETMQKLDEAAATMPATRTELMPGHCFGPYQLVRRIAVREQEHVFEAQVGPGGLVVTLHVLPPALTKSPAAVKHFVAEAVAKSEIECPAFLRATKAAQTEGVYYHTLEHVDATCLENFGRDRLLTESQVLEIFRNVSRAMSELQSQHQLHHPLGPKDILLDSRGEVRITNLASLRPDNRVPVQAQIESLAEALVRALGPAGPRAAALKRIFRRIERPGTDQITTWAGLRKAVEGISVNALTVGGASDEHTSFIVNLVPDRPTIGIFKIAAAAAAAGVVLGTLLWGTGRLGSVNAREVSPVNTLMASEMPLTLEQTNIQSSPDVAAAAGNPSTGSVHIYQSPTAALAGGSVGSRADSK